jgi:MFS family permease
MYTYVGFMIHDMGVPKEDVGPWAGGMGAAYYAAATVSAMVWGGASDKYGRKPVFMGTMLAVALGTLIFSVANSLGLAICARVFTGLFASHFPVGKAIVNDVANADESMSRAKAMGYVSGAFGAGAMVGMVTGGVLARPCLQYPSVFGTTTSIFCDYPYFLIGMVQTVLLIIAFFINLHWMPETRMMPETTVVELDVTALDGGGEEEEEEEEALVTAEAGGDEEEDDDGAPLLVSSEWEEKRAGIRAFVARYRLTFLCTCIYGVMGFAGDYYKELAPLYLMQERESGGLDYSPAFIGGTLLVGAISNVILQTFFYAKVIEYFGSVVRPMRFGLVLMSVSAITLPLARLLPAAWTGVTAVVAAAIVVLRFLGGVFAITSVNVAVNVAAQREHAPSGRVNGISQSVASFGRMFGPLVAGPLLTLGLKTDVFPVDYHLPFIVLALCTVAIIPLTYKLPDNIR